MSGSKLGFAGVGAGGDSAGGQPRERVPHRVPGPIHTLSRPLRTLKCVLDTLELLLGTPGLKRVSQRVPGPLRLFFFSFITLEPRVD